jgi:ABC-type transporter Mla subunit MlaD
MSTPVDQLTAALDALADADKGEAYLRLRNSKPLRPNLAQSPGRPIRSEPVTPELEAAIGAIEQVYYAGGAAVVDEALTALRAVYGTRVAEPKSGWTA